MPDFLIEREQLNPHSKPTNKHGNNGGSYQSGRPPTRWKTVMVFQNMTRDEAIDAFHKRFDEPGWKLICDKTGEEIIDNGNRF